MSKLSSAKFVKTDLTELKLSEMNELYNRNMTQEHKLEMENKDLQESSLPSLSDINQEYSFKHEIPVSIKYSTKIQLMRIGGVSEEPKKKD